MPLQYKRLYKGPLDQDSVFTTMEAAEEYVKTPIAYPGQILSVKNNGAWAVYIVTDNMELLNITGNPNNTDHNGCIWEVL